MGSFVGHAVPGAMFFLASMWWLVCGLRLTLSQQCSMSNRKRKPLLQTSYTRNQRKYRAAVGFTESGLSKVPFEAISKVTLCTIGVLGELLYEKQWTLISDDNTFVHDHLNNYAHTTMYCMFGLSGVVDLFVHYNLLVLIPNGLDHLFLALAFFVEGLLFYFHLDGRPQLDVRVHTFVYLTSFATSIVLLVEITAVRASIPMLARAFLTSLQGTWFFQVAFVLHGHQPWENSRTNTEFITIAFGWHIFVLAIFYLIILVVAGRVVFKVSSLRQDMTESDDASDNESNN